MNRREYVLKTARNYGKEHTRQGEPPDRTFKVLRDANKIEIKDAVEKIFKVKVQ